MSRDPSSAGFGVEPLVRALASTDNAERDRAADEITDVHRGLAPDVVETLVQGLIAALLIEQVPSCQEAELNALGELKAWHRIPSERFEALKVLRFGRLQPAHVEYLDELFEE
jgi:hypothetical protein